ncbi:MAG: glutamine-hydrolyzing carbamoyl-phosphate synthase small subunit [Richelia sp. SL_2_1]|nr:glutamine-hydrolyzing carbamoyl-phosphate synthase small subunit [Richelia sp. RM1_1_1]NJO28756.1 glutamine-hydrolyzing carbamoyl-phosphate synthase small subunit [Richelia sp. SL_2_1]
MPLFDATPALLVLADGTSYRGWSFGASGTAIGEVVFNTGMTGYQEVMTDPSYCGQIIAFTYPELGNTGVNLEDAESDKPHLRACIARNICDQPSNWRATQSLPDYLKEHQIPGIYGIDTRALTRKIRNFGAMNGGVSTEILDANELLEQVNVAPSMSGLNLVKEVTTSEVYEWSEPTIAAWEFNRDSKENEKFTVVALDFGVKRNILRRLASHGCRVIVVPADTSTSEILKYNPDGIFLSNGPGDPSAVTEGVETAKALLKSEKPIFGICMGHQILGQALGAQTYKLKFGHRGLNQPAGLEKRIEITSQNHSFAINPDSLPHSEVEISHLNLNDSTVAGVKHKSLPVFSVQYHPEASPGPHDADYLFEDFVQAMRTARQAITARVR